jgi:hypothetical protein
MIVEIDEEAMTASLVREYTHPKVLGAAHEGNMQVLPNGDVFVGWGSEPYLSEFNRAGELLYDANFLTEQQSYRAFRFPWKGRPQDHPAVVVEPGTEDKLVLYVSWNGATEVATWEVLAGPSRSRLRPIGSVPRDSFETAITVHTAEPLVDVQAKDRSGLVLGVARAVEPGQNGERRPGAPHSPLARLISEHNAAGMP